MAEERRFYGLIAAFDEPDSAIRLTRRLNADGIKRFDVYSPLPLEEMEELLERRPSRELAFILFVASILGLAAGYFMQYGIAAIAYPINVGGRPLNSWPAFVPTAWEICALFVVYIGFFAFLIFCGLPQLYHPIFEVPGFERATQDRTFLCVESGDEHFDRERLENAFREEGAIEVREVPL